MRTAAIFFFLFISLNKAFPQDEAEIGIFAGSSYYMGNINTSNHFYKPSPAFGAMVKYNIDEHYAVRVNLNYGQIRADDLDFDNILHQTRQAAIVNNFYDFSFKGEFSFQPFKATIFRSPFSTYITAGLSYSFFPDRGVASDNYLNIPFGAGIKYGISRKVTVGMEWILKKYFSDDIDNVKSFGQFNSPSLVHNNDWVSLAGFFVTIKPFERRGDCPPYWD